MVHLLQYWNLWCFVAWRNRLARAPLKGSIHKCSYQKGSNLHNRKGSVPKSWWVCFDPWILPEHLPPSWQSPEGRPDIQTSEVSGGRKLASEKKKRMTAASFTTTSDFFTPKNRWNTFFWIFDLSSAWGHIHIQRSHRLFRWLLERAQKRPRIPEMMSCVKQ